MLRMDERVRELTLECADFWLPPERMRLSEWAERNMVLSSEYSARSSNLKLYGWQKAPFDAFTDPYTNEIVLYCSTQMIKTLLIQAAIAYVIKEQPGPILLIEPKEEDGKEFSRERLVPMIRDCECLHGLLTDSTHDGTNTILSKSFPGGRLAIVSSIVPGNMSRRSIRYLFADEVDKYPASAGREGDPMDLAAQRLVTFGSRAKTIRACSPTVSGESRIAKAYAGSDRRKPWVACWKCGVRQILQWEQVKWDSSLARERQPASAHYQCVNPDCRATWTDVQRWKAANEAEWRGEMEFRGIAGFWINHLYSPWKKLSQIVEHFLAVKDNKEQLRVFLNTVLAQEWEERGETPDDLVLFGLREDYPHGYDAVVPERGLFLTAAVDVQDSPPRLETEVRAWGRNRETWSVCYSVIQCFAENGQPLPVTSPELWARLDSEILQRDWRHAAGGTLAIRAMGIDTGSRPAPVYSFARAHAQMSYSAAGVRLHAVRTVIPTKGNDDPLKLISGVSKEDAARRRQHVRILSIGTHAAKAEIFDLLRMRWSGDGPAAGRYHFPNYERTYFQGLCSELRIVSARDGKVSYIRRQGMRNEPLDCAVINRAMAAVVGIDRFQEHHWAYLEKELAVNTPPQAQAEALPVPLPPRPAVPPPPVPARSAPSMARRRGIPYRPYVPHR